MADRKMQAALWCVLRDKEFVRHNASLIDPNAIPRGPLRYLVAAAVGEWKATRSMLTPVLVAMKLEQDNMEPWGTTAEEVGDLYADGYTAWELDEAALPALRVVAANWFKQQTSGQILDEATEALEGGNLDAVQRSLRKAGRSLADPHRPGLQLGDMLRLPPERPAIPTGLDWFDRKWKGGIHHGQLATILAPSNGGKSVWLPFIAASALKANRGVLYYTTELSDVEVMRRIASALSGTPWPSLNDPAKLERTVKDITEIMYLRSKQGGEDEARGAFLEVRYRDAGSMSVPDIEGDLEELAEAGHAINMVIMDGDDLIDPKHDYDKQYDLFLHVYTQLSQMTVKRDIGLWTAAQGTRDSFKREILEARDIGDSIWKMRKADLFLAVNMIPKNVDENGKPIATFSIIKDRHYGTRGKVLRYVTEFGDFQTTKGVPRYTWWERPDEADGFKEG